MRLRALHLTNVRRFTGKRASITGIGDGITVVSEANEFGKSTFFDAIHALFFEKYSSSAKPVKSLRPYAGGAVEIAAEVQSGDDMFRVEKRFLSRAMARVSRLSQSGDVTLAQDDEAERWILELLGSAQDGPAGFLWVRQGLVGLEPSNLKEKTQLVETRRDLLSSVAGEIDTMTGGRRMDRVMARVLENLGAIATKTGKERGPWKKAVDEAAALQTELEQVEAQVNALGKSLQARQQTEQELRRLNDPAANARRKLASDQAKKAFDAAKAHEAKVEAASQDRELAALHAKTATEALDRFLQAEGALKDAQKQAETRASDAKSAQDEVLRLKGSLDAAEQANKGANDAWQAARKSIDQARRAADAKQAQENAATLRKQIAKAQDAQQKLVAAQAKVSASGATADWLMRIEQAADDAAKAQAAMAAQQTTLRASYDGAARIRVNGQEVSADQTIALEGHTELDLPGIGQLTLKAQGGNAQAKADWTARQSKLAQLLAQEAVETVQDARKKVETTRQAITEVEVETALLATLAPDGVEALQAALAQAELAANAADQGPDQGASIPIADLEAELTQAEARATQLSQERDKCKADHAVANERAVKAAALVDAARNALERAEIACAPEDKRDDARRDHLRAVATNDETLQTAETALRDLKNDAPDLLTAQAELKRATDSEAMATAQLSQLNERLAALSSEIRTLAGNGIEERRDELAGQLASARDTALRFERQAAALSRLQTALDDERTAARDTYFGPVQEELTPLLSILHRDAALSFDGDSLLPSGLKRDQADETMDSLSGGTQEQIAILTRLAFARLFAKQGRQMPIILDDALVYSDDDRIIKMFTALTRVAQDQQIIVFSCRQLAFQDLGGARPNFEISDL